MRDQTAVARVEVQAEVRAVPAELLGARAEPGKAPPAASVAQVPGLVLVRVPGLVLVPGRVPASAQAD